MKRANQVFASTLLLSLAVHLLFLASSGSWWSAPVQEIPFPIEASLALPEDPAPTPAAAPKPQPVHPPARVVAPAPVVEPVPPAPEAIAPPQAPGEPMPAPVEPVVAPTPPALPPIPPPVPEPQHPPAQRVLPERLTLRYAVQAGEGGFNLGQAIYTWMQRDGRYTLVSIAQATGLTSLFVSGRLVQTSEGTITPYGLQPEQYWLARNEKRQDTARFDWHQNRLVQGGAGTELPFGSQDVLSFPFHLAMLVDANATEWDLAVTNGRKLREYHFRNLGHERVAMGENEIDTLHLQGSRAGEGTLDVWLAPSRHWLPLRIRTLDQKGKVMGLNLEEIS